MHLQRVRFTIRSMMIAVGIAAAVLALERLLFHCVTSVGTAGIPRNSTRGPRNS